MEATYCVGNDSDITRMFDQYFCKRENSDMSPCSMPLNHNGAYSVNEQTFHTPSFGDEDFDITPLGPTATPSSNTSHPPSYQHQVSMANHTNEPMSPQRQQMCNTNGYHYMTPPLPPSSDHSNHNMGINVSANYSNSHPQPVYSIANNQNPQLILLQSHHQQSQQSQLHQQPQQPSHYNVAAMRSYAQSPQANSPNGMASTPGPNPPGAHETTTTSDDSDDSTPHTTLITGVKRPSPEPIEHDMPKIQKKPKPTKKKKKKDPNEPQKPVSAYALFFRDTQAAIKGQNPNTSFGEVSKIVASMWDGLDAEHKNVYKKKTELAKKDYLKQLAAYRATLVSKSGENESSGYAGGYGGYGGGYSGYSPPAGLPSPPIQSPSPHQQMQHGSMNKKSQMIMTDTRLTMNGHQTNMMTPQSHMTQTSHIDHQSQQQQQQQQATQVNTVPQQQTQPLNPNYPHQQQSWPWCYRMGPGNQ
ncbi:hypothetical protein PGB90_001260 [Kerria lacca]